VHRPGFVTVVLLVVSFASGIAAAGEEVTATVTLDSRAQLEKVARHASVDRLDGMVATVVGSEEQLAALEAAGFAVRRLPAAEDLTLADMCPAGWVDDPARTWDCYPSYPQYVALLGRYAADRPDLCVLSSLGPTTNQVRPHELLILRISDNPLVEEAEPEVLLTSSMHGDETTGYVLTLRLIDELLAGYGTDPQITALVDGLVIWINPLGNPDGTFASSDTAITSPSRSYRTETGANAYMDPNRNFPDPRDGDHPDGLPWWIETRHWMAFAEAESITLAANFHGGAEVLNYPWDTWTRRHVDDAWLIHVSRSYADQVHVDSGFNGYLTDLDNGITNGSDWYVITGGRQDYFTYFHGAREITFEISHTKTLPASQLEAHWSWNRKALLGYLAEALEGIHGVVLDDAGRPVGATIEIVGLDSAPDNSFVRTDPDVGDYHRMLLPGSYTVRISAYGYLAQETSGVVVTAGTPTILDATLQRLPNVATVTGEVTTPGLETPVDGAVVEIVGEPIPAVVTDAAGLYTVPVVVGGPVTVRVRADGFETVEVGRTVAAPATTLNFGLAPLDYQLQIDLETDDGGLVGDGPWQHGTPSGAGNPGAHSGSNVWATNLSGEYPNDADANLVLTGVDVPAGGTLELWHSFDIEQGSSDWDGGNVAVRPTGAGSYTVVTPDGGYPSGGVSALGQAGYTGSSDGWAPATFDLSAWSGQKVDLRWRFASDGSVQELGWYLDDIAMLGAAEPEARFEVVPALPGPGQAATLVDRSTGAVLGWSWDLGDGATADVQNPVHAWTAPGTYDVTLTASWADGQRQVTHQVEVGGGALFADGFESGDTVGWSGVVP